MLICGATWAQQRAASDYPNKPIRFVVPFVPGGPMDVIGRLIGQKLLAAWGQNVIIDNRAGAGGIIGTETVAKAPPDGYTLLHTSSSHAQLPAFNKLPYDPVRDFAPVTTATRTVGYVLSVHPSIPVASVAELIALAKKNPARLNYGNSGYGGVLHVGMEMFNAAAGVKMTTVQYKGIGQLVTDLAGGHIDLAFLTSSNAVGMAKAGKIKALAISGAKRWKQLPDVPTVDEASIKGFEYYAWFGFWYPAATPFELVNRMHGEIAKATAAPDLLARFDELGFEPYILAPADFAKLVQRDIDVTKKLAAQLGVKLQ
ncbi:MAG TPA: tripartite tricarboxylate transporter substrate binding protein [Burkholderiales bacterium]|nr:tripartite tricarboxylate transporter substrate binding protein [Burkholderiales bacterium]